MRTLRPFDYFEPAAIEEATKLLSKYGERLMHRRKRDRDDSTEWRVHFQDQKYGDGGGYRAEKERGDESRVG